MGDHTRRLGKRGRPLQSATRSTVGIWPTPRAHWKGGEEHTWCGDTGAHSMVASMAAAAIDGSVFATPLLSG